MDSSIISENGLASAPDNYDIETKSDCSLLPKELVHEDSENITSANTEEDEDDLNEDSKPFLAKKEKEYCSDIDDVCDSASEDEVIQYNLEEDPRGPLMPENLNVGEVQVCLQISK